MSSNNGTEATQPPTSETPQSSAPSSNPPSSDPPSSAPPSSAPPSSTPPASTPTPEPSSSRPQTSVVTASTPAPSTRVVTSVFTPSASVSGETPTPSVILITVTASNSIDPSGDTISTSATSTSTSDPLLQNPEGSNSEQGGLTQQGRTAIAVVVPIVAVALLVIAGILLWRRRKQKKNAEDARRKEVEEYGFNPNNDPTLPPVGMATEMTEDASGYRGWGNATTSSNRKMSTTLNSGMTYSDSNSNPGGYHHPHSPTHGTSEGHSVDPLMDGRRETMNSEGFAEISAAAATNRGTDENGVARGPSNASSSYSAANRSDNSDQYPMPNDQQQYYDNDTGYYQNGPYEAYNPSAQPIIRDVSARRNTRIENPSVFPQQGNSGIAQNF